MKIVDCERVDELISKITEDIFFLIMRTIETTGSCIVALSGGSSPLELYKKLGEKLSSYQNLPIHFLQTDERFVSSRHPRCNQTMIIKSFNLKYLKFLKIPTTDVVKTSELSAKEYNNEIQKLLKNNTKKVPDLIILGMGEDGHTASLFPNNKEYRNQINDDQVITISTYVPSVHEERISLSTSFINKFKMKILLMFGELKALTLGKAIIEKQIDQYPILSVLDNLILYTTTENKDIIIKKTN